MWFDQGLNLLHDFWDYESVRAFEQSVRVDPQCAMCYWGIYQAEKFRHSNSKYYADQALNKAATLKGRASKSERLYIDASVAAEADEKSEKEDKKAGDSKEVHSTASSSSKIPKTCRRAFSLRRRLEMAMTTTISRAPAKRKLLPIFQAILKDDPENSAANHYWIHAVEASQHPEQALHSA